MTPPPLIYSRGSIDPYSCRCTYITAYPVGTYGCRRWWRYAPANPRRRHDARTRSKRFRVRVRDPPPPGDRRHRAVCVSRRRGRGGIAIPHCAVRARVTTTTGMARDRSSVPRWVLGETFSWACGRTAHRAGTRADQGGRPRCHPSSPRPKGVAAVDGGGPWAPYSVPTCSDYGRRPRRVSAGKVERTRLSPGERSGIAGGRANWTASIPMRECARGEAKTPRAGAREGLLRASRRGACGARRAAPVIPAGGSQVWTERNTADLF